MGPLACSGASLLCSFGSAPAPLTALGIAHGTTAIVAPAPVATIMDHVPALNIAPFGLCSSPTNPAVIAQGGVPTACVPATATPWIVGAPTVLIGDAPALDASSTLMCTWLGVISIVFPGQTTVIHE